jgi:phosphoribosylformylglycinamidine synthase
MIYRVEVSGKHASEDPSVANLAREAGINVDSVHSKRVFFLDSPDPVEKVRQIAIELLADPVVEIGELVTTSDLATPNAQLPTSSEGVLEIHLKPGVMDPVAESTEMALRQAKLDVKQVRTGRAYRFSPAPTPEGLKYLGSRVLGNSVIEAVHLERWLPAAFPEPRIAPFELKYVPIRTLTDHELQTLSRAGHLFLNLTEMKAIQSWYRDQGREPTDVELETLAQTWSEHCVHKTLKSKVEVYDERGNLLRTYANLIKDTIFASTVELMEKGKKDFCLSVFKDNAGVIAFDETDAVCIKVETHNRPSAIDPYGGAATGVGGVIRDVIGTGLGAKPIANTDVFCVAMPQHWRMGDATASSHPTSDIRHPTSDIPHLTSPLPPGVLHPKRVLTQVVAGVRDYGNRMGIPTVNGAVFFDDRYVANPLVFCGCVGILPRNRIAKAAKHGDAIVVVGGRTGRDGIHGATFSSAELTSTHADEFSHAVQIGNAITEKKMMDVVLQAADRNLYTAITDCGAGGLSSAVGEMGEKLGAEVHLERVPLKYAGLRYDEIWISEAQERIVISVPQANIKELLDLAASEDVEATVIGTFGTTGKELKLYYQGTLVGRLGGEFLHDGIPMPTRRAVVGNAAGNEGKATHRTAWWSSLISANNHRLSTLNSLLSHPNIASKQFIVRQYDHEVQGMSVVKPFVGPGQRGPSDGSVLRPKVGSRRGVAIGCGLSPWTADPYEMALHAIDEAIRNVVAVGGDPDQTAILDNFCWAGTDNEQAMGDLVRTAEACRDAALAYRIPFISGKDSLHNQYTDKSTGKVTRIPNTLLITALSIVPDSGKCVTMDLKKPGNALYLLESGKTPEARIAAHRHVAQLIASGQVHACHDVSDGGWLTAAAEMAIASNLGLTLDPDFLNDAFDEVIGAYLLETSPGALHSAPPQGSLRRVATVTADLRLVLPTESVAIAELAKAWMGTLDW